MAFEAVVRWNDEQAEAFQRWLKWNTRPHTGQLPIPKGLVPLLDVVIPDPKWIPKRGDIVTVTSSMGTIHENLVVVGLAHNVPGTGIDCATADECGVVEWWPIHGCTFEPWTTDDE